MLEPFSLQSSRRQIQNYLKFTRKPRFVRFVWKKVGKQRNHNVCEKKLEK